MKQEEKFSVTENNGKHQMLMRIAVLNLEAAGWKLLQMGDE